MERRLPLKIYLICSIFMIGFLFPCGVFSQSLSQKNRIQFVLWAEREVYPGAVWNSGVIESSTDENDYSIPVNRLKTTAPFFVEGMLYGWNVDYVPYDKARRVQEIIEFEPFQNLSEEEKSLIRYKNTAVKDDRLYCRVEFDRSQAQINLYESWKSIVNPKVRGIGYASLDKGFEGIKEACADAIKNAVREYWRGQIKNKPKEIFSRVLLCAPPVVGVDSGRYKVMLDFFIETDKIVEYEMF